MTAIYNRYGYVCEMRRALKTWVLELLSDGRVSVFGAAVAPVAAQTKVAKPS